MQSYRQILDKIREYVSEKKHIIIKSTNSFKYTSDWKFGITDSPTNIGQQYQNEFAFPFALEFFECATIIDAELVLFFLEFDGMEKDKYLKNQTYSTNWDKIYVYVWKVIG